ncbi:MAG: hypothetical protein ACK5V9_04800, partial [Burkholderiales bacterium]
MAGWTYVGEHVVGEILVLEKKHRIQADTAYGQVFKGISVRLTPVQVETLRLGPSVGHQQKSSHRQQPSGSLVQQLWQVSGHLARVYP